MDDYIKRKSVYDALCKICNERGACEHTGQEACHKVFAQIPAADVRENRRGEWINGAQDFVTGKTHECSICGGFIDYNKGGADDYYFCPYCGADMRGEKYV